MKPHNPIENVIIIIKENHSFDNYFGTFPGADGVVLERASDPPAGGDPPHTHGAWLEREERGVRQQYIEQDIPDYFKLAREFTLCDHFFTEIAGPSAPNHLMLIAGDSPIIDNAAKYRTYQPQPPYDLPSLPENLSKAGLSWKSYGNAFSYFNYIKSLKGSPYLVDWKNFDADVASGNLPQVSWLYASMHPDLSEHPPYMENAVKSTIKEGMAWTMERINRVRQSDYWDSCVIFVVWDDWGGWYDHVEPPFKEIWKGGGPQYPPSYKDTQFSYGPRVPCIIVSPYARKGINKNFHSHVSILRFCETTFGLSPVNARCAASDNMSDCFLF